MAVMVPDKALWPSDRVGDATTCLDISIFKIWYFQHREDIFEVVAVSCCESLSREVAAKNG